MNKPRVKISLGDELREFNVGDVLIAEYSIEPHERDEVKAVEGSVIWQTIGKGGEDIGVHFFERRQQPGLSHQHLKQKHKFSTVLPNSPLSYDGKIVRIQWRVRIRVIFAPGIDYTHDLDFKLGQSKSYVQLLDLDSPG